jgi:ArsR family transcriptional regulator
MKHDIIFKALADPNRLKILDNLCASECACRVTEIACCCAVDLSVVSRHLKILKEAGIITSDKKGKEVFYQVNRKETADLLRSVADRIENTNCCKN